ncbi:phage tail tube protein [Caulobacter sp. SSI4214]|uniref:phage tail tube protein n=1 Tax=Caulobacter sp. SSI4214 TaxID=2575739 RepID=UPI00143C81E1|nr:phage tail tube protein [Caulobacter sp. SSI4214]
MANAQGVKKRIKRAIQTVQGTPQTSGSQLIRRTNAVFKKASDTFKNAEIVDHMQSTGDTEGTYSTNGKVDGLLSPATYVPELAQLLRKDFVATTAITGMSITIAASGQTWIITRAAGSFLTDGIKVGDVVRLTAGSFNAANLNKNVLVLAVTALGITVIPLNGVAMVVEATAVTGATLTIPGKKCWVPTSGHTDTFYTWEVWYPDVPASRVYPDCKVSQAAIQVPATGNPTVSFDIAGLSRTTGTTEVLTSPTAATTTAVLADAQAKVIANGIVTPVTSLSMTINGNIQPGEAEVGSQARSGHVVGVIDVSGTITAKFSNTALQTIRDNQSNVSLIIPIPVDGTAASDFVCIVVNSIQIFTDDEDDGGAKEIILTYNWVAEIPATGGAALPNWQTIVSIQDSQAP